MVTITFYSVSPSAHFKYFLFLMWNISFVEVMRDFTSQTFRTKGILHRLFSLFLKSPILIQLLQWETRRERQRKVKDSKRHSPGDHFSTVTIHGKHFIYCIHLCWKISISWFPQSLTPNRALSWQVMFVYTAVYFQTYTCLTSPHIVCINNLLQLCSVV